MKLSPGCREAWCVLRTDRFGGSDIANIRDRGSPYDGMQRPIVDSVHPLGQVRDATARIAALLLRVECC